MMWDKHRFEIWNQTQHPYKHSLGDFSYVNPAAPGSTSVEGAFNWIFAVLYPQTKPAVNTTADLPTVGNALNDYRVVQDDGDGKAAGYRWEQREGEASPSWHKIYDMDWGSDSILEAFQLRTQDLYVFRRGYDDIDNTGAKITGLYAGQVVTGGLTANSHLTLRANAGDGVGVNTGFVQADDNFRPTVDDTWLLGTATERWKEIHASMLVQVGTLTLASGGIYDSGGQVHFQDNIISTEGDIFGSVLHGQQLVLDDTVNTVTIVPGSYTDTSGTVDFGATDLSTTGDLAGKNLTLTDTGILTFTPSLGKITSSLGVIDFDNEDLITTGDVTAADFAGITGEFGNLQLSGNTISSMDTNGAINLSPNGTGIVNVTKQLVTLGQTVTGTVAITGQLNADNLRLDGNVLSATDTNGSILISPNGTGQIVPNASVVPGTDNVYSLGAAGNRFASLFLGGGIGDGSNSISIGVLLALRSSTFRDAAQTLPAQTGDALFYDSGSGLWLASAPDSEITHASLSGLTTGDAGHTQFALLAGRAGGQTLQGGTASGNNLIFESTSNAGKGSVQTKDNFVPFTNASYSGGWQGTDLGDSAHYFRDIYTKGEAKGLRFENVLATGIPASSMQSQGRVVFTTDTLKPYIDTGVSYVPLGGGNKFLSDVSFDGIVVQVDVNVSANITDARMAVWQLKNNANNFEVMLVSLKATSASNVRITTNVALPAGSYRLIGLE